MRDKSDPPIAEPVRPLWAAWRMAARRAGCRTVLVACGLLLFTAERWAQGDEVAITTQQQWSNVFGGTEAKLDVSVASRTHFAGVVVWSYSANGRTILRGEAPANVAADGNIKIPVPLRFPAVKEGVIFATELSVSVASPDGQVLATMTKPIWLFPRNAFFERARWLEERKITLFDPSGQTADVFNDAAISFQRVRNLATLGDLDSGLLIVGEGVSLARNRSLAESLVAAAARGRPVLCLAPGDGQFPLPGDEVAEAIPRRMTFRRNDLITALDKRLDARQWTPDAEPVTSRLRYRSYRNRLLLEVSHGSLGWPWWEMQYGQPNLQEPNLQEHGALVVCGFGLIEHWHAGPTPRFLLARIIEYLTEDPNNDASHEPDGE